MSIEIQITVVGQKSFKFDHDYGVTINDLARAFKRGQEHLSQPAPFLDEGIITGPNILTTYRMGGCLVDNRMLGTVFDGVAHGFIIAGSPEEVPEFCSDLRLHVPRHRAVPLECEHDPSMIDITEIFQVNSGFDLYSFQSAEKVWEELKKEKRS